MEWMNEITYVYMYVCMYVWMYVCMNVCMYVRILTGLSDDARVDISLHSRISISAFAAFLHSLEDIFKETEWAH